MTRARTESGTEQHYLSISGVERKMLCQSQTTKGTQEEECNFSSATQPDNQA